MMGAAFARYIGDLSSHSFFRECQHMVFSKEIFVSSFFHTMELPAVLTVFP